jgi:membrane protease YdiL (CAAX protease family)
MSSGLEDSQVDNVKKANLSVNEQLLEILVFLFLIVPSLVFSFFAINQGTVSFVVTAVATILRDLALVALILFFLWRNKEKLSSIGWTLNGAWREVLIGIVLFAPVFFGTSYLDSILQSIGLSAPSQPLPGGLTAVGPGEMVLAFFLVVIVAISEETIFRGYSILRYNGITRSIVFSVLFSAFIFSLGHGYEGSSGVVTVGVLGLIYAIIYVWRGSLVAPMVLHFLQDFLAIVLLPLLGLG